MKIYILDGRTAPVPRLWIRSAEVRGERRWENGNTTTKSTFEPRHDKTNKITCALREDSDHPISMSALHE